MKPYYDAGGVVIYHADCRDVMGGVVADSVVTDPPYGYMHKSGWDGPWKGHVIANDESTTARDDVVGWAGDRAMACFGSWRVPPPANAKTALVWDKGLAAGMGDLSIPWKCNWEVIWIGGTGWSGHRGPGVITGHNVVTWASKGRKHPNEKPVSLLREILRKAPPGTVFDPFMGSGSTLRAAKDLGLRAVGCDVDERWCEVAAKGLAQESLFGGAS